MALATAASYSAALLARLPTATILGRTIYAATLADASPDVRPSMPASLSDDQAQKLGNSFLPALTACISAINFGQFVVDMLADVDVVPSGTPPLTINDGDGVTPVVGKGKLT